MGTDEGKRLGSLNTKAKDKDGLIKGGRSPALDATGSSSAAGQSEAKNCPPFACPPQAGTKQNRKG